MRFKPVGLFGRKKREQEWLPVEGREDLVMTKTDEVEEMVNVLATEVYEDFKETLLNDLVERKLLMAYFVVTKEEAGVEDVIRAAAAVARVGYISRADEWERLESARKPEGWAAAGLLAVVRDDVEKTFEALGADDDDDKALYEALAQITAYFVRSEQLDPPHDAESGINPMWTVPGMGGDFRSMLREKTMLMIIQPTEDGVKGVRGPIEGAAFDDFRKFWKFGFLLRSFEEFYFEDYEPQLLEDMTDPEAGR